MKKKTFPIYFSLLIFLFACKKKDQTVGIDPVPTSNAIKVVLKLDDIGAKNNSSAAAYVMDYLIQRKVKASYGVIANRLDGTAKDVFGPYINATNSRGEKMVEIWHHGLDHSQNIGTAGNFEFKYTSYAFQKMHFDSANNVVKRLLGIQMTTFGAPFNATDTVTMRVINENPNYKMVMYSSVNTAFPLNFKRANNGVNMEITTGVPDYEYFLLDYDERNSISNVVIQAHPGYWDAKGFAEFKKILDYLDAQHCVYVLPSEL